MKKIILLTFLIAAQVAHSQTFNIIKLEEFNNIKINGASYYDLNNSQGNPNDLTPLLGNPISQKLDPDGNHFEFSGLSIGFSALLSSDYNTPILSGLEISNNQSNLKIKNSLITIGDNISKLGSVNFNTQSNGEKSILYSSCNGCNQFFKIEFNQTTKIITKISFIEMT